MNLNQDLNNWILITGVAGFVGSHLSEAFLKMGQSVIGIDNFDSFYSKENKLKNISLIEKTSKQFNTPFIFYEIDILSLPALLKSIESKVIRQIIHLAARAGVNPSIKNSKEYYETNIMGTLNILELCKEKKIKELIFASSSSIYGNNKKIPFSESDYSDCPISPYASSKKAGELACHTYAYLYGIKTVALRFFTIYGARQRPDLAIYKFTRLINAGLPISIYGNGTTSRDYTYIEDIIDGILKASQWITKNNFIFEVFNLGGAQMIKLNYLITVIESALMKKAKIIFSLKQAGDVLQTYADITKAKKFLGYHPDTDIKEGILKFVTWFKTSQ